jgi:hypothetical protein
MRPGRQQQHVPLRTHKDLTLKIPPSPLLIDFQEFQFPTMTVALLLSVHSSFDSSLSLSIPDISLLLFPKFLLAYQFFVIVHDPTGPPTWPQFLNSPALTFFFFFLFLSDSF